jgi:hypothetical protein
MALISCLHTPIVSLNSLAASSCLFCHWHSPFSCGNSVSTPQFLLLMCFIQKANFILCPWVIIFNNSFISPYSIYFPMKTLKTWVKLLFFSIMNLSSYKVQVPPLYHQFPKTWEFFNTLTGNFTSRTYLENRSNQSHNIQESSRSSWAWRNKTQWDLG